ncbi:MAG TPA: phage tail protein [Candidatus Limnocylindrales bacterium]|jgi:phage tail-like protein
MGDPAVNIAYKVTIDGFVPLGMWTKVDGLGMEYQITEYREGGINGYTHKILGPCKYTNLRLSRPVDSTSDLLMIWLQSNMLKVVPQTMAITAMTAGGEDITTWNLAGVVPVKWTGPSLDVMSNNVSTETLEVVYQEIIGLGALGGMLAGAMSMSASVSF